MRGFLETRPQKVAVQFLSEMAKSATYLWTSRSPLRLATNLVVSSWAYLFIAVFRLPPRGVSRVMGNIMASGVLEAIAIGLRNTERRILIRFKIALVTSHVLCKHSNGERVSLANLKMTIGSLLTCS